MPDPRSPSSVSPPAPTGVVLPKSLLTGDDLHLFNEGTHTQLHQKMGAHPGEVDGAPGTFFAVWAPNARHVGVMGDFNGWCETSHPLVAQQSSGIFAGFVPGVGPGALYKYAIHSREHHQHLVKADPFGNHHEEPPRTASVVWQSAYTWGDGEWMAHRHRHNALDAPMWVYEVHLGSWRQRPGGGWLSYREVAEPLGDYVQEMGYTHVQFLPLMEHPFYGSWGYQTTGYFAPTSRYGTPDDLRFLIDHLHQRGIGVFLDWVPSHFPTDGHGLAFFDGTHLFEHADPRQGFHPDWKSAIFNYGRREVQSFLISSARYWLDEFHADGLRVDAVASMLYLDYSRDEGGWVPNVHGGRENLEAIAFLKRLNETLYLAHPDVQIIAEESTAWPGVSRPTTLGGLGFGMKWDMGWMHDTLLYYARDPIHRCHHHHELTFRQLYALDGNFMLPLSHDEVVHGKGSLLGRLAGDDWQKFAGLRLLLGQMAAQPGKKLLFMGNDLGPWEEWRHDEELPWHLLDYPVHQGVQRWVKDLLHLVRREPALYEKDFSADGFEWMTYQDGAAGVLAWVRRGRREEDVLLAVAHTTPVVREGYAVPVPLAGPWAEVLNSDAACYGGSGVGNDGGAHAVDAPLHGQPAHLTLRLPPLGILLLKPGTGG